MPDQSCTTWWLSTQAPANQITPKTESLPPCLCALRRSQAAGPLSHYSASYQSRRLTWHQPPCSPQHSAAGHNGQQAVTAQHCQCAHAYTIFDVHMHPQVPQHSRIDSKQACLMALMFNGLSHVCSQCRVTRPSPTTLVLLLLLLEPSQGTNRQFGGRCQAH